MGVFTFEKCAVVTPWEFIIMNFPNVILALSKITNVMNQTLKVFIPKNNNLSFKRKRALVYPRPRTSHSKKISLLQTLAYNQKHKPQTSV